MATIKKTMVNTSIAHPSLFARGQRSPLVCLDAPQPRHGLFDGSRVATIGDVANARHGALEGLPRRHLRGSGPSYRDLRRLRFKIKALEAAGARDADLQGIGPTADVAARRPSQGKPEVPKG